MILRILITLSLALLSAQAQRGLRDIPDPDPAKQKAAFNLPEGMEIELYASDPMIAKPVQMNFDPQGRLWLVSSSMYPHIVPGAEENDRVLVLEDTNGDGKADKKTVFADNLHIPTAVMPADGGAYVANSTEILFLEDTDGDGKADKRTVLLSGFGTEDSHHFVHTFKQGPDGMIYFMQSLYIHSHIETPYGVRRLMAGGIWQFRPETHRLEILSRGLINPWGFVFDDYGQTFATDGAGGEGINFIFPRSAFRTAYGVKKKLKGLNPGQPKLCGLEILSGSHIPENLRGILIAPDFRGHRINSYKLTPNGSTYTSTRVEDFLSSSHRAFRPVDVKMGPDGALYIADWYNPIIQHGEVDFRDKRRDQTRGRIWRVTFKGQPLVEKKNLAKASIDDLLKSLVSKERGHRDLARTELRNRKKAEVLPKLKSWSAGLSDDFARLQALWMYQALNVTNAPLIEALVASTDYRYRAAALRVVYERYNELPDAEKIVSRLVDDKNPQVRLWAITCLAQMPSPRSVPTALRALDHPVDEPIDFALWSIVREHEAEWAPLFESGKDVFGGKLNHLVFAMKALGKPLNLASLFKGLSDGSLSGEQKSQAIEVIAQVGNRDDLSRLLEYADKNPEVLENLITAKKIRKTQPSKGSEKILPLLDSNDAKVFANASQLAGLWKLSAAREKLIAVLKTSPGKRKAAALGLRLYGGKEAVALFEKLSNETKDGSLHTLAVKELASLAPYKAAAKVVQILAKDDGTDRHGLLSLFLKNPRASATLAKALKGKTLPTKIASLGVQRAGTSGKPSKVLIEALTKAGNLKPMTQQLSKKQMEALVKRVQAEGDPHQGETIYRKINCVMCHAIGGVGSPIGPDLVSMGASAPVDYIITSLLDPNDKIKEGYHTTMVTEKNGNVHSGGLVKDGKKELVLRDNTGKLTRIAATDIKTKVISNFSMMPPGLTAGLREDEFVDIVRFLSELGKEGDFKTGSRSFVRKWKVLKKHQLTLDQIRHLGSPVFAKPSEDHGYEWIDLVSRVNGELKTADVSSFEGVGERFRMGVMRFGLNPDKKGTITLKINDTTEMSLFDGEKKIKLPSKGSASVEVTAGGSDDRFTLVVSKAGRAVPILIETISK
ncbi:MAG: PVC-type heme-binding CxxCH protein [Akkermansiaceae bacterium]